MSEGNLSRAELNLRDDQLRLRGGKVRRRRRGIRVTSLAKVVDNEDEDEGEKTTLSQQPHRGGRSKEAAEPGSGGQGRRPSTRRRLPPGQARREGEERRVSVEP